MQEVADNNGWVALNLTADGRTGEDVRGIEFVLYVNARGGTDQQVLIAWTPENTGAHIEIQGKTITGMCALIEARQFIEKG
jgi:hypothetical protein